MCSLGRLARKAAETPSEKHTLRECLSPRASVTYVTCSAVTAGRTDRRSHGPVCQSPAGSGLIQYADEELHTETVTDLS